MTEELARDSQGGYAYNPEYFGKTGTPYSQEDHDYLVKWYDKIPLEEMAFALERTPTSIEARMRYLKKNGLLYTYKAPAPKPLRYKDIKSQIDTVVAKYFNGIPLNIILEKNKANA